MHVYEVRRRKDHRGVDLIIDVLPFGRLWYTKPDDAIGYAMHYSRSHDTVIRVLQRGWRRNRDARAHWRFQGMVNTVDGPQPRLNHHAPIGSLQSL